MGDFRETRPILVKTNEATYEDSRKAISNYRLLRLAYESALINQYEKEPLVDWEGKRYPISILSTRRFAEGELIERFDSDFSGGVKKYDLPEAVIKLNTEALLRFMENNPLARNPAVEFNDSSIAHPSRLDFGEKVAVWYQESTYFKYVLTMLAMDVYSKKEGKRLRDMLEPGGPENAWTLTPIERSPGGGTLGVVCFVKTSDEKFVVSRRSSNVANAKNTLVPSCGGFLRWVTKGGAPPSIFWQARGHMEEELSVLGDEIARMECIGITRDLERAGHLDAHFYVEILPPFEKLDRPERRARSTHGTEIESYTAVEAKRLATYISHPDAAPILMGSIYLLQAAHFLSSDF